MLMIYLNVVLNEKINSASNQHDATFFIIEQAIQQLYPLFSQPLAATERERDATFAA